jgi:radical SAM protein with 4Fe4S-binding SPASM domain
MPNCSASGTIVGLALVSAGAAAAVLNAFADKLTGWLQDPDATPQPNPTGSPPAGSPPTGSPPTDSPPTDSPPTDASSDGTPPARGGAPGGDGPRAAPRAVTPSPSRPSASPRVRLEADHALLAWPEPAAILTAPREVGLAAIGRGARAVGGHSAPAHAPSAPVEAHISLGDRCPARCPGCYVSAGPQGGHAPADALRDAIDGLAALGVFELALGGGEPLAHPDLPALLAHARGSGLVPNLTTTGLGLHDALVTVLAGHVGQVNVTVDGLGDTYTAVRGYRGDDIALDAIERLVAAGIRVGVNTVLTRANLHQLEALGDALAARGVSEWQWLRFKPAGRGAATYAHHALTAAEAHGLWPRLLAAEARTGLVMRIDCALVPFLVAHDPDPEAVRALAVAGCEAGRSLWSRTGDGRWAPCSFAHDLVGDAARAGPEDAWQHEPVATAWRARAAQPPAPCASCSWQDVCRGGCRIVAQHLTGDALAPDPECPRVRAHATRPDHPPSVELST